MEVFLVGSFHLLLRQSCQLFLKFDQHRAMEEESWTTEEVLDQATRFYVNNWSGMYTYQTIW